MADPHWTSYVGMFTGISGAVLGFISYQKSKNLKSLDLRLELRKGISDLYQNLHQLNELIVYANKSRQAVLAATGNLRSGRMELWKQMIEQDTSFLSEIKTKFPEENKSFSTHNAKDLESEIIEVHKHHGKLKALIEKYNDEVNSDDEQRRHIRDTHGG